MAPSPLPDWKQAHANAADAAMGHPLVMAEAARLLANPDIGEPADKLVAAGLHKLAHTAAQVARAQALGFDPDLLRLSSEEADSLQLRLAAEAAVRGVPIHLIEGEGR